MNSITSLTSKQVQILENLCNKICNDPKIRFCGIINSLGRLVTGGFSDGIEPLDNEDQRRMLYMQSTLDLSMKGEFNENLGNVNFITTYRDNVAIINIPLKQNYLLLMSVERNAEIEKIVKNTIGLFESTGVLSGRNKISPSTNKISHKLKQNSQKVSV